MLMESLNLASIWNLPVLFVCKDDGWAVTTQSERVTGGDLNERARGLGVPAVEVDGGDVSEVWEAAHAAIERARAGQGPAFLHARCMHLEGHFLGFQPLRKMRDPLREIPKIAVPLTRSFLRRGGTAWSERVAGLKQVLLAGPSIQRDPRRDPANDPVRRARNTLRSDPVRLQEVEDKVKEEISRVIASALAEVAP